LILRRASAMEDRAVEGWGDHLSPASGGEGGIQIKAHATDEAGKFIALGRMTNQSRRFVDDQQAGVFVEDGEQVFQTRGDFNHETHERQTLNSQPMLMGAS